MYVASFALFPKLHQTIEQKDHVQQTLNSDNFLELVYLINFLS